MRNFSLFLIFLLSLVFMVSCGSDSNDDPTGYTCAPANPTGTCEAGKTCQNGICVTQNQYTCSATNPTGTCETGKTCQNGTCVTTSNACSATNPTGTCDAGKVCQNGTCVVQNNACSATNPTGTCDAGKVCQNGTCVVQNNACSATNPTGTCEAGKVCQNGVCVTSNTACSPTNPTGTCPAGKVCTNGTCTAPADGQLGGACSETITCVGDGMCLTADGGATFTCYEPCTGTNDSCTQSGYACVDTGVAEIGWICMEGAGPGGTPIGGDCAEENCVEGAMCLNTGAGTPSICYEKCTGTNDTCTLNGYACVDTGVAGIDWICMEGAGPGTTPIGGDCSTENCVAAAMCLNTGAGTPQICYEKCTGTTDNCTLNGYECVDTGVAGIDWICMEGNDPGTTPIGGNCATENCVAAATCLTDGTNSICYENCDPNTGGACSQNGYTCESIEGGSFCFEPAGK